ncbi:hypothetical protein FWH13_01505 [Candidatus Saccharibacteria bacterium]|nr:hypothetical protein [Candidatus Saccharibacteria bacterium]
MLWPNEARSAIAANFYDKTINVLAKIDTVDEEGGLRRSAEVTGSFMGNVRFTKLELLQKELGLVKEIDAAISCAVNTPVEAGSMLEYQGVKYAVDAVLPRDSHKLIIGSIWQSK